MAEDDRAIVVGISRYPAFDDLAGPENDASAFAEWLTSPTEGNVPEKNVRMILSSAFPKRSTPRNAEPTAEAVKAEIDRLHEIGTANKGRAGRRLYMFMAGHGIAPTLENVALLMANAARGRTGHHIAGRPYANWFRQAAFFEEVVLFMDCCSENSRLTPIQRCHLDKRTARRPARYYYGLAAEFNHKARELAGANNVVHGVFTNALLTGLRHGFTNGGDVTGTSLARFVFNYMQSAAVGEEERQLPKFYYDVNDDIVFVRRDAALIRQESAIFRVTIRTAPSERGRKVEMRDGKLMELPPSACSEGVWQWNLEQGLYQYGYPGREGKVLQLIGPGREIHESL